MIKAKSPARRLAVRVYARWGQSFREEPIREPLAAVERLLQCHRELSKTQAARLVKLIEKSDRRLRPLADPLRLTIADHRWLHPERNREESYSDWLAWILNRSNSTEFLLRAFGLKGTEFQTRWQVELLTKSRGNTRSGRKSESTLWAGLTGSRYYAARAVFEPFGAGESTLREGATAQSVRRHQDAAEVEFGTCSFLTGCTTRA